MSASTTGELIAVDRKVGPAGRASIPHQIRYRMGIEPGDDVKFIWDGETLELVKSE